MSRPNDVRAFYDVLSEVSRRRGGVRPLTEVLRSPVPLRGVYFFFEPGEMRSTSGSGPRVVRVGTHALRPRAKSTLRGRLRQHGGSRSGGGNHRGSIFRLLIGDAMIRAGAHASCVSWGVAGQASDAAARLGLSLHDLKTAERALEAAVSARLAAMTVLCLPVEDEPGPTSLRAHIERNSIALLSNESRDAVDPPSLEWLGHNSSRSHVRSSGLWNQEHVTESYDLSFLKDVAAAI
jgi:hypothetical protein